MSKASSADGYMPAFGGPAYWEGDLRIDGILL